VKTVLSILVLAACCFAQGGRFAETKRLAFVNLESGNYNRASALFEEVWENEQPEAVVAESLAIAYLNCEERRYQPLFADKAADLMDQAIRLGGQASFLVHHSKEKLTWLQGRQFNDYCSGRLSLRSDRLVYITEKCYMHKSDPFDVAFDQIKKMSYRGKGKYGAFVIVLRSGNQYVMAPRTKLRDDTEMLFELARKYMAP
jgi:hypothetical protein